jgi:hypothetical protein
MFGDLCKSLRSCGGGKAKWTLASVEWLRRLLDQCVPGWSTDDVDGRLAGVLVHPIPDPEPRLGETGYPQSPGAARTRRFEQVLQLQRVTPIAVFIRLGDALRAVTDGKTDRQEAARALERLSAQILLPDFPAKLRAPGRRKDNLRAYDPRELQKLNLRLSRLLKKKKAKPKDFQEIAGEYWEHLANPLAMSLAGLIYARFLDPDDPLVRDDPLFLRKHEFVRLEERWDRSLFGYSELKITGEGEGSYALGGFGDFAAVAGQCAARGIAGAPSQALDVIAAQSGALRATEWSLVKDDDARLLALQIRAAREWTMQAALSGDLREILLEELAGLVSPVRRAKAADLIEGRAWRQVWETLTLTDLFFLGERLLARGAAVRWPSPAAKELVEIRRRHKGKGLDWLGPTLGDLRRFGSPRLRELPPYEDCALSVFMVPLAQRTAEFSIYLADYLSSVPVPAAAMSMVAEPLARRTLQSVKMAGAKDWISILRAYSRLDKDSLKAVLEAP